MRPDGTVEESPVATIYRELVEEHAERLYGFATLLLGDPAIALQTVVQGFQRTWDDLRRDRLVGDADETLYWTVTRQALRRRSRSREVRGLLPATTADDRQITAFGVTSGFSPQQQAAIYLAAWARVGYRLAGLASGIGEGRARDLAFSARQEYREARGGLADESALCGQAAPVLSARADGEAPPPSRTVDDHLSTCSVCRQTAASYEEFGAMLRALRIPSPEQSPSDAALDILYARPEARRSGPRRLLRLVAGPAILVLVLIVGLVFLRGCQEATIATGVGRTSDLLYARDASSAIVVLDSGSGRELERLPNGVLSPSGQRVYSVSASCPSGTCTSTIRMTDTATMSSGAVGRVDGQIALLGVDEARGRLYLGDAEGSRLLAFDSSIGQVVETTVAPDALPDAFAFRDAVVTADGSTLFTLASGGDGKTAAVQTSLRGMRVVGSAALPGGRDEYAGLLPDPSASHLFAYQLARGTLHDVDLARGEVVGSAQLESSAPSTGLSPEETGGALARSPDGSTLYAVLPSGGVGVVKADALQRVNQLATDKQYRAVVTSTDGHLLYVVGRDGGYEVLQVSNGQPVLRRPNVGAVALLQANAGE